MLYFSISERIIKFTIFSLSGILLIIPFKVSSLIGFEIKSSQPAEITCLYSSLVEYAV